MINSSAKLYNNAIDGLYKKLFSSPHHDEEALKNAYLDGSAYWLQIGFGSGPNNNDDCDILKHDMKHLSDRLKSRAKAMHKNKGGDRGHKRRYNLVFATLKSMVKRAKEVGCEVPKDVQDVADTQSWKQVYKLTE